MSNFLRIATTADKGIIKRSYKLPLDPAIAPLREIHGCLKRDRSLYTAPPFQRDKGETIPGGVFARLCRRILQGAAQIARVKYSLGWRGEGNKWAAK